jgi:hypothetical protein
MTTFPLTLESESREPVAPYWHTAIFVAVLAVIALNGVAFQHQGASEPQLFVTWLLGPSLGTMRHCPSRGR